jgi:hypothetical protein
MFGFPALKDRKLFGFPSSFILSLVKKVINFNLQTDRQTDIQEHQDKTNKGQITALAESKERKEQTDASRQNGI